MSSAPALFEQTLNASDNFFVLEEFAASRSRPAFSHSSFKVRAICKEMIDCLASEFVDRNTVCGRDFG